MIWPTTAGWGRRKAGRRSTSAAYGSTVTGRPRTRRGGRAPCSRARRYAASARPSEVTSAGAVAMCRDVGDDDLVRRDRQPGQVDEGAAVGEDPAVPLDGHHEAGERHRRAHGERDLEVRMGRGAEADRSAVGEVGRLDEAGSPEVAEPGAAEEAPDRPAAWGDAPPAGRPAPGAAAEPVRHDPPLGPRVPEEVPAAERRAEPRELGGGVAGRDQSRDERADRRARDLGHAEAEALDGLERADVGVAARLAAGEGDVERGAGAAGHSACSPRQDRRVRSTRTTKKKAPSDPARM